MRTSYVYDAADRLTGQQYQDGTRLTMTYDADSRRTVLNDWTGLYTSTYDSDSRVSSTVNPAGIAVTYTYNAISQRTTLNQPGRPFHVRLRSRRADQHADQPRKPGHELAIRCGQPSDGEPPGERCEVPRHV